MSGQKQFNVYIYLDPQRPGKYEYGTEETSSYVVYSNEPFYVGAGGNFRYCVSVHKGSGQKVLEERIIKIGSSKVIVLKIPISNEAEALEKEKELIALIGRKDLGKGPLLNMKDDAYSGYQHTILAKQKIGEASSKLPRSAEWRKNISDAQKGKPRPQTTGKKHGMYGKHHSKESLQRMRESRKGQHAGEKHPLAKLTEADVLKIRKIATMEGYDRRVVAKEFGVSVTVITNVVRRKTWRHI